MIEGRSPCATVNIPDYGILFIELLTRRSGEVGGEKWEWLPFTPMNKEHGGDPPAVDFHGRVYIVGCGECVNKMEMLDAAAGSQ
ncbi:unnamed protein product [Hymenolepis diminuta]|uniref:F-box/kelch-repeat protein n=1 Tax=Hymenolepis diminuta TaxID=6216 RepID=A0A0R3SMK7_HYMDI|nr:unnamed protein product [Hymenolepis diminuta]